MKTRFPYPGEMQKDYYISQYYNSNPINGATGQPYYSQHHGGWDIVPLKNGNFWPAPIYPVLDGRTLGVSTSDIDRGLGIKVRTTLDSAFIAYFKSKGYIPASYQGQVFLDHLYWHMLQVTDLDTQVNENVQVGLTGNSGYVFSGGLPVPDSEKNKPPYPGGHCHFEYYLTDGQTPFNLDKDAIGRLPPEILFAYKGQYMGELKTQNKGGELRIVIPAESPTDWVSICKKFGLDPSIINETI